MNVFDFFYTISKDLLTGLIVSDLNAVQVHCFVFVFVLNTCSRKYDSTVLLLLGFFLDMVQQDRWNHKHI